jgi:hypothetical protein
MAVIILSILIAFAVDAGWEARQDRIVEREILRDLAAEAEANLQDLEIVTERQKDRVRRIEALLDDLEARESRAGVDSIAGLGSFQVSSRFRPRTGVMRELVASGDMRLLENRELRSRIAGFDEAIASYVGNSTVLSERRLEPTRDRVEPSDWVERPISENAREVKNYLAWVANVTRLVVAQADGVADELNAIRTLGGGM